jgi:hypothetical protein
VFVALPIDVLEQDTDVEPSVPGRPTAPPSPSRLASGGRRASAGQPSTGHRRRRRCGERGGRVAALAERLGAAVWCEATAPMW